MDHSAEIQKDDARLLCELVQTTILRVVDDRRLYIELDTVLIDLSVHASSSQSIVAVHVYLGYQHNVRRAWTLVVHGEVQNVFNGVYDD